MDQQSTGNLPAIIEDFDNVSEDTRKKYGDLLDLGGSFGQSLFSEEHFVLNPCLTPKRTLRQALMHYDGKQHAYAEARFSKVKANALRVKIKGDIKILIKIQETFQSADTCPKTLPNYSCEYQDGEVIKHITFDPHQIVVVYEDHEWNECREHLNTELQSIIDMKKSELATLERTSFQQEKLIRDSLKEIEWYKQKLPELEKAARDSEMSAEEEEHVYWKLRQERFIEMKQLEGITGIPQDYLESISNLPDSMGSYLIEFAKENKERITKEGVPNQFIYKKHMRETNALLTGSDDSKKIALREQSLRNTQGNIALGLLYRTEEEAKQRGACDPLSMLIRPQGYNIEACIRWGSRTDHARNEICKESIEAGADWLFFVDDDVILPKNALQILLQTAKKYNLKVIAGDYPLKIEPQQSASLILLNDGTLTAPTDSSGIINTLKERSLSFERDLLLDVDSTFNSETVKEKITDPILLPIETILHTGCMLINVNFLKTLGNDWFQEVRRYRKDGINETVYTDDYPFTQKCIECEVIPVLHTGVCCQHVDTKKRIVYGKRSDGIPYCINNNSNPFRRVGGIRECPRVAICIPRLNEMDVPLVSINHLDRPKTFAICDQIISPAGLPVDEAFNHMANTCLVNGVDYMVIIESDMIVPRNALQALLDRAHNEKLDFVCAQYPRKEMGLPSSAIILDAKGIPIQLPDPFIKRGIIIANWVVPFGCCIINMEAFADLPTPWFMTVPGTPEKPIQVQFNDEVVSIGEYQSHDAFFCERWFKSGFNAYIDTDIQCLHVDRNTRRVYGSPKYINDYKLNQETAWKFAIDDSVKTYKVES